MQSLIRTLESLTRLTGQTVSWLSLLMVLATCAVVVLRYVFSMPSVALQESVMYLHASLFMLGAAYTWQQGGHVRVDIFYQNFSARQQIWVERLGILLLVIPFCVFLLWVSWTYVGNAWAIREKSQEASGLPLVYLLKTLILLLPVTLLLQGLAELLKTLTRQTPATESDHG